APGDVRSLSQGGPAGGPHPRGPGRRPRGVPRAGRPRHRRRRGGGGAGGGRAEEVRRLLRGGREGGGGEDESDRLSVAARASQRGLTVSTHGHPSAPARRRATARWPTRLRRCSGVVSIFSVSAEPASVYSSSYSRNTRSWVVSVIPTMVAGTVVAGDRSSQALAMKHQHIP